MSLLLVAKTLLATNTRTTNNNKNKLVGVGVGVAMRSSNNRKAKAAGGYLLDVSLGVYVRAHSSTTTMFFVISFFVLFVLRDVVGYG